MQANTPDRKINTLVFLANLESMVTYEIEFQAYNQTWGDIYQKPLLAFYTDSMDLFLSFFESNKCDLCMVVLDAWPSNREKLQYLLSMIRGRDVLHYWPPVIVNAWTMGQAQLESFEEDEPFLDPIVYGPLTMVDSSIESLQDLPNRLNWALFENMKRPKGL